MAGTTPHRRTNAFICAFAFILFPLFSATVTGFGIWTVPSDLELTNVPLGQEAVYGFSVMTDSENAVRVHLSVGGDVSGWVSVSPGTVTVSSVSPVTVRLLTQAKDILPGEYIGSLVIKSNAGNSMTAALPSSVILPLSISVTDDMISAAQVDSIKVFDSFAGDAIRVEGEIRNTGNTQIMPLATIDVIDDNGVSLARFVDSAGMMPPGEKQHMEISGNTSLAPGIYTAKVEVGSGNLTFIRSLVKLRILASDGMEHTGILDDVQAARAGDRRDHSISISGAFRNIGQGEVKARLTATVSSAEGKNSSPGAITGDWENVPPNSSTVLYASFVPGVGGVHDITAYVEYGRTRTVGKSTSINLGRTGAVPLETAGFFMFTLVILVLIVRFIVNRKEEIREGQLKDRR